MNGEKSPPTSLSTIAFAAGTTSELFSRYATSPSLDADCAVGDTVTDSGWPAYAHQRSLCHSKGAPTPARPGPASHKRKKGHTEEPTLHKWNEKAA